MRDVAVRIAGLCKAFGANDVLKGIDLDLPAGAVTALMGANGAGKSTLVKVLSGVHAADAGRVSLAGAGFAPESPAVAMAAGVVTVHQSIADGVVGDLDVASNLMLDRLAKPGGGLFVNRRRLREGARAAAAAVGLDADLSARVADLSLADRQLVAIARALAHSPRLLILDEPTSSLSAAEAERLFALIDRLREEGVCILYISHRMSDIRRIADRIASMRDGRITGLFDGESLDYEGAVRAMLGHGLAETGIVSPARGRDVLRLEGLRLRPGGAPLTLALGEGEVVAVTGLVGAGKTALAEALFGLRPVHGGAMALDGAPYAPRAAADAVARGVFLCAKDRAANGAIPDFDLAGNVTLPFLSRYATASLLNRGAQRARTRELIAALGVICRSERDPIGALSGGNQQKIMVARWLSEPCRVLVLDEPFQGVDIQARRDIGAKIRETAGDRATVVMVAELDEALEIADRIVVMSDGAVVGQHLAGAVDLEAVLGEVAGAARGAAA